MEKTFETPGVVRLYVENHVGLVTVTAAGAGSTSVSLEAESLAAEELVGQATVECRPAGPRQVVTVQVPRPRGLRNFRRSAVTVRVTVPEGSELSVVTASADVEVQGPVARADVKTASGNVLIDDVTSDVVSKTASGNVTLGHVGGDVRAHSASGHLRCDSVGGRSVFATTSGDLQVGAAGNRVEVKATSGNVRLGRLAHGARIANVSGDVRVQALSEGHLRVRSVSGDVFVGVVQGVQLHVDVETMSGSVHSDIPLGDRPPDDHHDARVDLSVRSVSGDVEIAHALDQAA